MIEKDQVLKGEIQAKNVIVGEVNTFANETDPTVPHHVKSITKEDIEKWNQASNISKCITNVMLENQTLIFTYNDGTTFSVTLNASETTGLTEEQIKAINEMVATSGEYLTLEYDDKVLDVDFLIEDNNLIVTNNVTGLNFNINANGEMEAIY